MTTEMLADRIDLSIAPLPGLIAQLIAAGNVRALAHRQRAARRRSLRRSRPSPKRAFAGVEADAWSALFAPARTPPAIIDAALSARRGRARKGRGCRPNLAKQGLPIALKTPAEIRRHAAGRGGEMGGGDQDGEHGGGVSGRCRVSGRCLQVASAQSP